MSGLGTMNRPLHHILVQYKIFEQTLKPIICKLRLQSDVSYAILSFEKTDDKQCQLQVIISFPSNCLIEQSIEFSEKEDETSTLSLLIIFVPEGDELDATRLPDYYDPIYNYFLSCGMIEV